MNVRVLRPERILLVSYNFPPVGGAGVQRMAKLVKYLSRHNVSLRVLTVANASVPLTDDTLQRDVPDSVPVLRAHTFEPGYGVKRAVWTASAARPEGGARAFVKRHLTAAAKAMMVPDPQVLWQPGAGLSLARLLASDDAPNVVCISGPPFSQFLLAPLAKLRRGTAVVLDYRDEWSTYRTSYEMMSPIGARVSERLEGRLLRFANVVVTATDAFRAELLSRFSFLRPEQVVTIPNGYDPEDLPSPPVDPPTDRFVLTYAGSVLRMNSPHGLLAAVRRLHAQDPQLAALLRVRFIGRIVETEARNFEGMEGYGVERLGYIPHQQLLPELSASHLVACILDLVPGNERVYPGKIFELMALGRPCLTLAPEGALTELVRRHRLGDVIGPRDEERISERLAEHLRRFRDGQYVAQSDAVDVERYDRRVLAERFLSAFSQALDAARR